MRMQAEMVPLVERLVVAVESISYEVRSISQCMKGMTYSIHDLNINVSNLLKEKSQEDDPSVLPCEEITEQTCVESVPYSQNEAEAGSLVLQTHALRNEETPFMNSSGTYQDPLSRVDSIEESYSSSSANKNIEEINVEEIKTEAENEEDYESSYVYSTYNYCINKNIAMEVKDDTTDVNEDWFSSLESSSACTATQKIKSEEDIPEQTRLAESLVDSNETTSNVVNSVYSDSQTDHSGSKGSVMCSMKDASNRNFSQNLKNPERRCTEAFKRAIVVAPIPESGAGRKDDKECGSEERMEVMVEGENEIGLADIREDITAAQGEDVVQRGEVWRSSIFNISPGQLERQPKRKGPFICETCGKYFPNFRGLENHQRSHTGEKPFECSLCRKTFSVKDSLAIHMQVHCSEKPFSCSICKKRFKRRHELPRHMRYHSGEKPFKCGECGKAFTESGHLIIHRRTHSGERPFSCADCGKSFTQSGNLATHRRLLHQVPPQFTHVKNSVLPMPHY